jgi:hypothetical protein
VFQYAAKRTGEPKSSSSRRSPNGRTRKRQTCIAGRTDGLYSRNDGRARQAERGKTYQKRRRVKRKKLPADLHQRILVLRIILQETLSIDVRRAYAGILPEEKARENESIGQALKHIDNVLRKLEKLGKETNPKRKRIRPVAGVSASTF